MVVAAVVKAEEFDQKKIYRLISKVSKYLVYIGPMKRSDLSPFVYGAKQSRRGKFIDSWDRKTEQWRIRPCCFNFRVSTCRW
jgi:hypothetical protein